jgi:hypothetical protein
MAMFAHFQDKFIAKKKNSEKPCITINYKDSIKDPMAGVERIYEQCGRHLSDEARAAMKAHQGSFVSASGSSDGREHKSIAKPSNSLTPVLSAHAAASLRSLARAHRSSTSMARPTTASRSSDSPRRTSTPAWPTTRGTTAFRFKGVGGMGTKDIFAAFPTPKGRRRGRTGGSNRVLKLF